ncbi:unnamed protein product [Spodoptera littoralis]|uniref:Malate dehydrogenase n=1 Tax=Spodoptera littoralis TaxID=7109 RepID=A0A9P0HWU7_SPOLI|nr:unnamed protein product [Spodoptera littoralis]CAH1635668.1 unnamed protein product [Spodoptera littoralis]
MNFQTIKFSPPVRVMMINPLIPASQLLITKILSGVSFGRSQLVDLILLVYANEIDAANDLGQELIACAFPCYNSVSVTSDLPSLADADVFCFMTNFENPNKFDFKEDDDLDKEKANEQFDNFYLIIKIATNLAKAPTVKGPDEPAVDEDTGETIQPRKPIILADGLLVLDILMIVAKTLPQDMLFATTPLRSIAKITLSEFLKVKCCDLNQAYVWAANDTVFHAEIAVPFLKGDKISPEHWCEWNAMSPEMLESLGLEHINFNASWMKREFIEKMVAFSEANPYGCIFKAAEMSRTMNAVWLPRSIDNNARTSSTSIGVISDGSLGTVKGLPYVLPLIITENDWSIDFKYEESSHLRHEIKRINTAAVEHHQKLVPYCKKFLQENVIDKAFIPVLVDSETATVYSSVEEGSYNSGSD